MSGLGAIADILEGVSKSMDGHAKSLHHLFTLFGTIHTTYNTQTDRQCSETTNHLTSLLEAVLETSRAVTQQLASSAGGSFTKIAQGLTDFIISYPVNLAASCTRTRRAPQLHLLESQLLNRSKPNFALAPDPFPILVRSVVSATISNLRTHTVVIAAVTVMAICSCVWGERGGVGTHGETTLEEKGPEVVDGHTGEVEAVGGDMSEVGEEEKKSSD